jgi:hypothetical protein
MQFLPEDASYPLHPLPKTGCEQSLRVDQKGPALASTPLPLTR